ncbi:hypothetical protein ACFPRL_28965 [Pseudoclavibacter helvolus]
MVAGLSIHGHPADFDELTSRRNEVDRAPKLMRIRVILFWDLQKQIAGDRVGSLLHRCSSSNGAVIEDADEVRRERRHPMRRVALHADGDVH